MSGHESASVEMDSRDEEAERILERTIQKALVEFEELYGYALYDWVNYRLDALWHKLHEELKDMCGEGLTITQRDFVEELLSRIAKLHANIYKVCNGWIASFFISLR